jgi:hypothetical protein
VSKSHYVWKLHFTYGIALCVYKSQSSVSLLHSWVSYSHAYVLKLDLCVWNPYSACKITLCVWKLYSACRMQSCACWDHTRAWYNHVRACWIHNACRNYTLRVKSYPACINHSRSYRNHTRECHIHPRTRTFQDDLNGVVFNNADC